MCSSRNDRIPLHRATRSTTHRAQDARIAKGTHHALIVRHRSDRRHREITDRLDDAREAPAVSLAATMSSSKRASFASLLDPRSASHQVQSAEEGIAQRDVPQGQGTKHDERE